LARIETHLGLRDMQKQIQRINDELEKRLEELACANAQLQERNEELDAFAHTVAHDLKNQYRIAYISGNQEKTGEWRRIDVRLQDAKERKLKVRAKRGYYAKEDS